MPQQQQGKQTKQEPTRKETNDKKKRILKDKWDNEIRGLNRVRKMKTRKQEQFKPNQTQQEPTRKKQKKNKENQRRRGAKES